jgi:hypothetical protein
MILIRHILENGWEILENYCWEINNMWYKIALKGHKTYYDFNDLSYEF